MIHFVFIFYFFIFIIILYQIIQQQSNFYFLLNKREIKKKEDLDLGFVKEKKNNFFLRHSKCKGGDEIKK